MPEIQQYAIPGLATVTIDPLDNLEPLVTIVLDPAYRGDLNDLEQDNGFAPGVYLECNSISCIDDPLLAKFMEVASHWDYDSDGAFDCDEMVNAIENALWRTREKPNEFHRPTDGWYNGTLMRMLPPPPARHIVFSFGELKERFRWRHYAWGIPLIGVIVGMIQLQIHLVPVMKHSVVSGIMALGEAVGISGFVALAAVFVAWQLLRKRRSQSAKSSTSNHSPHTYGFFNKAAVYEEQAFREGAENWGPGQRVISCLVFGAVHMTNLIYPLATILPLSLGGAVFMFVYLRSYRRTRFRRNAVLDAALVHRVYNRIALTAFAISLVIILGWAALGMFGIAALLVLGTIYRPRPLWALSTSKTAYVLD